MTAETNQTADETPAPYHIEGARSSRSKCKTCRRSIQKGRLRMGIRIEGPFGTGYLWHHLECAARKRWSDVEEAYQGRFWEEGLKVPTLDKLRGVREKSEREKTERKEIPHVEVAPTGRSKCKHCGEPIAKASYRFVLARQVEFYNQVRAGPVNVHPQCVTAELEAEDCATEAEGFAEAVRTNSRGLDPEQVEEALSQSSQPAS